MTTENIICFISCVNSRRRYSSCKRAIRSLFIPPGMHIERIPIYEAHSMVEGYNKAMKKSEAKYKVYLHQDVEIANRNFIQDVVDLFRSQSKLGILGVVGSKTIPCDGIWWKSKQKLGQVYDGSKLLYFGEPVQKYEEVRALDGSILITQYDITWREDLFTGWHFYDISQCLEFVKAGYQVGIPQQSSFWCIHRSNKASMTRYNRYRRRFVRHYKSFLEK